MTVMAEPFEAGPLPAPSATARREERLLRQLERASASSRFNLGERWLFAAGGALVIAGFVVVLIGWAGASGTVLVAGQIPYLISGGMIGLGLVFLGGFLYFGHWLAVLVRESRERGVEDREDLALVRGSLDQIHQALTAVASALPNSNLTADSHSTFAPAHPATVAAPSARAKLPARDDTTPILLATSTGTMAHRPGCRALTGKPNLRPVSVADGLKPCGMCRPLDPPGFP